MDIPSQKGRVVLVTGANSGVGRATAEALAQAQATVLLAGRDPSRIEATTQEIRSTTGNPDVHGVHLDLGSLVSVRDAARHVLKTWDALHVLVNNAGVMLSQRRLSPDGYELTFATNHLGPYLLTELLLDRLLASAPSRIVFVSSAGHRAVRPGALEDLQAERSYSAMPVYMRSKLANVLSTTELAERLEGSGVSVFAVNPGSVRSRIARDGDGTGPLRLGMTLAGAFSLSARSGAGPSLYAATAPDIDRCSGSYYQRALLGMFGPIRQARPSSLARDLSQARRLRDKSEHLIDAADHGASR